MENLNQRETFPRNMGNITINILLVPVIISVDALSTTNVLWAERLLYLSVSFVALGWQYLHTQTREIMKLLHFEIPNNITFTDCVPDR